MNSKVFFLLPLILLNSSVLCLSSDGGEATTSSDQVLDLLSASTKMCDHQNDYSTQEMNDELTGIDIRHTLLIIIAWIMILMLSTGIHSHPILNSVFF